MCPATVSGRPDADADVQERNVDLLNLFCLDRSICHFHATSVRDVDTQFLDIRSFGPSI